MACLSSNRCSVVLLVTSLIGCGGGSDNSECVSESDCSPGFACIDGTCQAQPARSDGGGPSPFDAGLIRFDAGSPVDAGRGSADAASASAPDSGIPADGGVNCGATACTATSAQCGTVIDGCGVEISCGDCPSGFRCGSGAFANRCQCEPLSCDALGAACGTITDNCGVRRDCGGCGARQACQSNQCVCVPRTCAEVGAACGTIDDGCGGSPNCGGCTSPNRCGGGGTANQCGCTTQTTSTAIADFRTANSVRDSGSEWDQLGDGVQINQQGANVRFGPPSGSSNDCSGTRSGQSELLWLRNAGLDIPSDAVVTGVEIFTYIKRNGSSPRLDELFLYGPNGVFESRSVRAQTLNLSTGYRRFDFGGPTDRWGLSTQELAPSRIRHGHFGIRLRMSADVRCGSSSHPFVDGARVRVHYRVCR